VITNVARLQGYSDPWKGTDVSVKCCLNLQAIQTQKETIILVTRAVETKP